MLKIKRILVKGFRSLLNIDVEISDLTVVIGENDSGKSALLDIFEIALNSITPESGDFYQNKTGVQIDNIIVELHFQVTERLEEFRIYTIENTFILKRNFTLNNNNQTFYKGLKPTNADLQYSDFDKLNADPQKEIMLKVDEDISPEHLSNKDSRIAWYIQKQEESEKEEDWIEVNFNQIRSFLPRFERYSAMDYREPESIITKTIRQIFDGIIYEIGEDEETKTLIEPLLFVEEEARAKISEKVSELEGYIKEIAPSIESIDYNPNFDFSSSIRSGEFTINKGFGHHALNRVGDGTKRRMFMAVTEWDSNLLQEQAEKGMYIQPVIRGYDEPDTNLHYEAQRRMFSAISDIVNNVETKTQAIICTHSLTMVDRAPAKNIRYFKINEGVSEISQLITEDDPEVEKFLNNIASYMGISNSIMFYERCFVLVEGQTEEFALPIFYKKVYGKTLIEDCIRIINVKSNSAVKGFLKLLKSNKEDMILIFVDSDSRESRSSNLSEQDLRELGFETEFIENNVLFVGLKEFEDTFSSEQISRALSNLWNKSDGTDWLIDEIEELGSETKFSKAIGGYVHEYGSDEGENWGKPLFGKTLAEICEITEIHEDILLLFTKARQIVGI